MVAWCLFLLNLRTKGTSCHPRRSKSAVCRSTDSVKLTSYPRRQDETSSSYHRTATGSVRRSVGDSKQQNGRALLWRKLRIFDGLSSLRSRTMQSPCKSPSVSHSRRSTRPTRRECVVMSYYQSSPTGGGPTSDDYVDMEHASVRQPHERDRFHLQVIAIITPEYGPTSSSYVPSGSLP